MPDRTDAPVAVKSPEDAAGLRRLEEANDVRTDGVPPERDVARTLMRSAA